MIKETIVKDDGRLLTFYSFADKKNVESTEASPEANDPCCCCVDSHKTDEHPG